MAVLLTYGRVWLVMRSWDLDFYNFIKTLVQSLIFSADCRGRPRNFSNRRWWVTSRQQVASHQRFCMADLFSS